MFNFLVAFYEYFCIILVLIILPSKYYFLANHRLSSLEYLSIDNNCLDELPIEVCHLSKLIELHAASNRLIWYFLIIVTLIYLLKCKFTILPCGGAVHQTNDPLTFVLAFA